MMDESQTPPKQPSIDDESWMDEMGWGEDAPAGEAPAPAMAMSVPVAAPAGTVAAEATAATFTPLETNGHASNNSAIDLLLDVGLQVTVELGRARMKIGEILALRNGSVIELDRLAGEPADILINGTLIARGEVVVIDEKFGVRIIEVVSRAKRIASLG
jgi:flagellar motor switch protein FliN